MRSVRNLSIDRKLTILVLLSAVVTLAVTLASVAIYDALRLEHQTILASPVGWYCVLTAVACLTSIGAALLLSRTVRRVIAQPIHQIAEVTKCSCDGEYNVRICNLYGEEISELVDSINTMLDNIQIRDQELENSRNWLEQQVMDRTAELRKANEELVAAKQRAENASSAKSQFLANVGHEIRTPMTAIVGYADMMLQPGQTLSDRHDALQVIHRNAYHLLELINNILDISRIEADRLVPERSRCDLPRLLADVCTLVRPRACDKDLVFSLDLQTPIPNSVQTDALRLKQILINLLGNAVKFTQAGSVRLIARYDDARGELGFEIVDTGIGIAKANTDGLFEPFTQADESMSRRFGGSGLGLTLSRRLARLLGGDITVQSVPGQGSAFSVTIKTEPSADYCMVRTVSDSIFPDPQVDACDRVAIDGYRILLAEDGLDNQRLIMAHLRRAGAMVEVAENGRVAVDRAMQESFDLILMDMQMPEMDGYMATSLLRGRGVKLPIIALTAHAMTGDRERCLQAGCTDYLTKPVARDRLLSVVCHYLEGAKPMEQQAERKKSPSGGEKLRSTFADDPDMRQIIVEFVEGLPQKVVEMRQLLEEQDLDALRRVAHQLKGAGGGYGFDRITEVAANAETAIKTQQPGITIRQQVDELVELVRSVEGYPLEQETQRGATHSDR